MKHSHLPGTHNLSSPPGHFYFQHRTLNIISETFLPKYPFHYYLWIEHNLNKFIFITRGTKAKHRVLSLSPFCLSLLILALGKRKRTPEAQTNGKGTVWPSGGFGINLSSAISNAIYVVGCIPGSPLTPGSWAPVLAASSPVKVTGLWAFEALSLDL
jgi:hypothetical protein